jgi:uncharacterized protein YkwD
MQQPVDKQEKLLNPTALSNNKVSHFIIYTGIFVIPDIVQFTSDCLRTHNTCRAEHGSPELNLSEDLGLKAQTWANVLAEKGYPLYSETPGKYNRYSYWHIRVAYSDLHHPLLCQTNADRAV